MPYNIITVINNLHKTEKPNATLPAICHRHRVPKPKQLCYEMASSSRQARNLEGPQNPVAETLSIIRPTKNGQLAFQRPMLFRCSQCQPPRILVVGPILGTHVDGLSTSLETSKFHATVCYMFVCRSFVFLFNSLVICVYNFYSKEH